MSLDEDVSYGTQDNLCQVSSLRPVSYLSREQSLTFDYADKRHKRRRSEELIDLNLVMSNTEDSTTVHRSAKKLCDRTEQIAKDISRQLQQGMELDGEVMEFLAEFIFEVFGNLTSEGVKSHLLETPWPGNNNPQHQSLATFTAYQRSLFLIYCNEDRHWNLGVSEIHENRIYFSFYGVTAQQAKEHFVRCIDTGDSGYEAEYQSQKGFLYPLDTCSSGIYALMYLKRIITGEIASQLIDPTAAREEFMDMMVDVPINSYKSLSSNNASILRRIKADQCGLDDDFSELDVIIPSTQQEDDGASRSFLDFVKAAKARGTKEQLKNELDLEEERLSMVLETLQTARIEEVKAEGKAEGIMHMRDMYVRKLQSHRSSSSQTLFPAGQQPPTDRAQTVLAHLREVLADEVRDKVMEYVSQASLEAQSSTTSDRAKCRRRIRALSQKMEEIRKRVETLRVGVQTVEAHDEFESKSLGSKLTSFSKERWSNAYNNSPY
ncbi:uncharacterized protein FIESC28_05780 [Fusarium coffeatum]|uniref:Uncharacterized protein n=1 Tax=Fusarium coffeatum TaxID=231269 RepID=A0A366RR25_9HYPO|nr:uncharacterized protein FIESC28_05780 [Fusarium coffeatum]RBR18958.1 hypothetical protein FIESC28_05780 [Fusarium coffeatum]